MTTEHEISFSILVNTAFIFLVTIACACFVIIMGEAQARLRSDKNPSLKK